MQLKHNQTIECACCVRCSPVSSTLLHLPSIGLRSGWEDNRTPKMFCNLVDDRIGLRRCQKVFALIRSSVHCSVLTLECPVLVVFLSQFEDMQRGRYRSAEDDDSWYSILYRADKIHLCIIFDRNTFQTCWLDGIDTTRVLEVMVVTKRLNVFADLRFLRQVCFRYMVYVRTNDNLAETDVYRLIAWIRVP